MISDEKRERKLQHKSETIEQINGSLGQEIMKAQINPD
jgi:hypothetical protein